MQWKIELLLTHSPHNVLSSSTPGVQVQNLIKIILVIQANYFTSAYSSACFKNMSQSNCFFCQQLFNKSCIIFRVYKPSRVCKGELFSRSPWQTEQIYFKFNIFYDKSKDYASLPWWPKEQWPLLFSYRMVSRCLDWPWTCFINLQKWNCRGVSNMII